MGQETDVKTLEFYEVETKYRVKGDAVYAFKKLVQDLPGLKEFVYVESDDIYYTNQNFEFLRYRFANRIKKDKRAELTYKSKTTKENNIVRKEVNLRVDINDLATVEAFANCVGYTYNFKISKLVHVYKFEDVTLPFYTVINDKGEMNHFVEIEVAEDKLKDLTEDQAWDIINKYEDLLAPLGISSSKRVKESLFEMYAKDTRKML